ncbi:MAG: hypothetical protein JXR63_08595 [Spirochaetales bacterium]|nr:hypothetical protein [Spirochaetales bacterium]
MNCSQNNSKTNTTQAIRLSGLRSQATRLRLPSNPCRRLTVARIGSEIHVNMNFSYYNLEQTPQPKS